MEGVHIFVGRWRTFVICLEVVVVVDGVEGLILEVLESEMEESLLGLADLFADFYIVS